MIFEQIEGKDGKPCARTAKENLSNDELIVVSKALWDQEEGKSGVAGVDDAGVLGIIVASMPVIAQVIGMMNKGGVDKNPYEAGTQEGAEYTEDLNEATKDGEMADPQTNEAELAKIVKEGEEDAKNGGEGDADEIWGLPSTVVYVGGAMIGAGILFLGLRAVINRDSK